MDFFQSFTPNGPTITAFKGWQSSRIRSKGMAVGHTTLTAEFESLVPPRDISSCKKQLKFSKMVKPELKFVTSTKADRHNDKDIRLLVCSHARSGFSRKSRYKRPAHRNSTRSMRMAAQTAAENHDAMVWRLFGCPTALCVSEYPIPMQPHSYQLLSIYVRHVTSKIYTIWQQGLK
jgi:hypothetical protein